MMEERLRDAFAAAAGTVRRETLRPLIVPARRARRWPVPVIAAASVVVVVAGSMAVAGRSPRPSGPAVVRDEAPGFFVSTESSGMRPGTSRLKVHDARTGKVIDTYTMPAGVSFRYVAPSGPGGDYLVTAEPARNYERDADCLVQTYRLRVDGKGRIAELVRLRGLDVRGIALLPHGSMAVSRDGKKVAYTGYRCGRESGLSRLVVREIAGGPGWQWDDRGFGALTSLSWTDDGRVSFYRANMGEGDAVVLMDPRVPPRDALAKAKVLAAGMNGTKFEFRATAVTPDGSRVYALVTHGGGRVSLVEMTRGRVARTLREWRLDGAVNDLEWGPALESVSAGRHLLLVSGGLGRVGRLTRWDDGRRSTLAGGEQTFDIAW